MSIKWTTISVHTTQTSALTGQIADKKVVINVRLLVATLHVGMTGFQDGSYTQWAQLQWDYLRWVKISFTQQ